MKTILLILLTLTAACDHTRNPLMFPAGPSSRDTCPAGTHATTNGCEESPR